MIDAFHTVSRAELPARFFLEDRQDRRAITLTDDLFTLRETPQFLSLPSELESRWRLIETAWAVKLNPGLPEIQHDEVQGILFAKSGYLRRTDVTSSRDALNGYQKGKCL